MAIIQLGTAFNNFFDDLRKYDRGEIAKKKIRRPKFKKKGKPRASFSLTNDQFHIDGARIHLPHIGFVRMREQIRFAGKIAAATISRTADRWFASITVEVPDTPTTRENQGAVGVDLGVTTLATLSTGENIPGPMLPIGEALSRRPRAPSRLHQSRLTCSLWTL